MLVTLQGLWLNVASDPSDFRHFEFLTGLQVTPTKKGTFVTYAGGRQRLVSTPGAPQTAQVTLTACTIDDRQWLQDRIGDTVCIRDDRGRRFFGAFLAPDVTEHAYNDESDISLTFNELTISEAV